MDKDLPKRKKNRLEYYDYSSNGMYFITICTKDRINLFWEKEQPNFVGEDIILPQNHINLSYFGKIVNEAINSIPIYYPFIEIDQYVIMPNHIHLILFIPYNDIPDENGRIISSPTNNKSISIIIGQMKRQISKKIGISIWQRSFHDHIVRNKKDYEEISKYIYENPIKWQYDCFYTDE